MAKPHGARQQKKVAKLKAKRLKKRVSLFERFSNDPTVRLRGADKWPVAHALVGSQLWKTGIGYLAIAREEKPGGIVYAVYLVDVYCLGVKDAFWRAGTNGEFKELIQKMEQTVTMRPIAPACLAKIVKGAVEYAKSFGFPPHADYRHAATLLEGIDLAACPQEFTFGKDGKPFYIQGPNESPMRAEAIRQRIVEAGGHFITVVPGGVPDDFFEDDEDGSDDDQSPDEWR